jgi:hypothetical protein
VTFFLLVIKCFRPALRAFGDLLSCIDKKVGKETLPVLVQPCVVKTFLPCPVLIRLPGSAKPGATSMSRSWIYFYQKGLPATHQHMG